MRIPFVLLAPLLLAAAPAPTTSPTTRPGHEREPWVFRCVLDGNARSVVVSLGHHRWVAYDAELCALRKFWIGDIELTGPVYDYKHGPQPRAHGALQLDQRASIAVAAPPGDCTPTTREATTLPADQRFTYRGYSLKDDRVTFHFEHDRLRVDETPSLRADADSGRATFIRTINVEGASAETSVDIAMPTSDAVEAIKLTEGSVMLQDKSGEKTLMAPAGIAFVAGENQTLRISSPGRIVIDTDLKPALDERPVANTQNEKH